MTSTSWNWRSTSAAAAPGAPDDRVGRNDATSSKVTTPKRRVRSTVCIAATVTPGVAAGTSTWVAPALVAAGDEEVVGLSRRLHQAGLAAQDDVRPVAAGLAPSAATRRVPTSGAHHDAIALSGEQTGQHVGVRRRAR